MKKNTWSTLKFLLFTTSLTIGLMACGGGGGGGGTGLSYSGITTQAVINAGNATDLAVGAWFSGQTGTNVDIFGAAKAEPGHLNSNFTLGLTPFVFTGMIDQLEIQHFISQAPYLGAVQAVNESMAGSCGGMATINGSANDETGAFNGSVNFAGYCENGVIINGPASLSGTIDLITEELTDFTLSFSTLTLEEFAESITINGSFSANYLSAPMMVTMSYVIKDNTLMETYWFRDAQLQLISAADHVDITAMSGRYYDPKYGYVEMSIGESVRINDFDNWPADGSIILTGAQGSAGGNTKASLAFVSATEFQVDADTDGDESYDDYSTGTQLWSGF